MPKVECCRRRKKVQNVKYGAIGRYPATATHHSWSWEFLSFPLCCPAAVVVVVGKLGRSVLVASESGLMPLEEPYFRCATDPQASGILPTACSLRRPMQEPLQVIVNETRVF